MDKLGRLEIPYLGRAVNTLQVGDEVKVIGTVHKALRYVCGQKGFSDARVYD